MRKHFKKGSRKFVVIEGNRRVAAIIWLLKSKPAYLDDKIYLKRKEQMKRLRVLLLDTAPEKIESDRFLIQGITHLNPARDWPAFAKARLCWLLFKQGLKYRDITISLGGGIKPSEVARFIKAYSAYEEMINDEEYSECAIQHKEFISYFSEILSRKELRAWLGWDDNLMRFTDTENLKKMYELLCGDNKKIRRQTDIRALPRILKFKPDAIDQLIDEPSYSIDDAYAEALREENRQKIIEEVGDWRTKIKEAIEALEKHMTPSLDADEIKNDIRLLTKLNELLTKRLTQLKAILETDSSR